MLIHSNATTCPNQRLFIKLSAKSCRSLAGDLNISPATVSKWKARDNQNDLSARPNTIQYAFTPMEQKFILSLREKRLSLDDLLDAVKPVLVHANRSSIHRLLVRNGVNKLPILTQPEKVGKFKDYEPGYLHIDCFYLPKIDGIKRYCFVAVDRATRLVFLHVYEHKDKESAFDFLSRCISFYPFFINKILTDNGREFTLDGFRNRYGSKTKDKHPFDKLCDALGIEHRRTRPYTPKTNGLVERTNRLIKDDTVKSHIYLNADEMIADLYRWFIYYNFWRKHRRIGRKTPYEKVLEWYELSPSIFIEKPTHLLSYCSQRGET
jgi:transposase-like protein